jgi:ATP-dependent Lhr-like helicase
MTEDRADLARMMPDAFPIFFSGRQPWPGQAIVMPEVVRGADVLFAAPTASGKTEAAVAPLYQRHISFKRGRLSTVYVAPTKALVNDLHERLICYLGTRQPDAIARYTGDRHELHAAEGVFCLLTTPEALDSLQLRRPQVLAGVRSVVVDEIHLLHGQPRGQQLRHVIARLRQAAALPIVSRDRFQIVGMTATLDDMQGVAKTWLGEGAKVLSHGAPREIDLELIEDAKGEEDSRGKARALARWLEKSRAQKVLVFANSRNRAHALAACLHRELEGARWPVHLHFGALAAAERERVEEAMRVERYGVCVATTTLEIGIDIGDVDAVVLSEPPGSVSGFLQRIGRGNRRSGVCRVIAFRGSDDDERLIRALVDCAKRGDLDDVHDYDRPSVRLQQVLSLAWRATRQDRPLSAAALCAEARDERHAPIIADMIDTGCLSNVRGALVPCDRLIDEADAGKIHSVIAGRTGTAAVDLRTGKPALWDVDEATAGGAVFLGGEMRRLTAAAEGGVYLREKAGRGHPLARIKGTGPAAPMSRSVLWGLARQGGLDPTRWRLTGAELQTFGGETFNALLAALFTRLAPKRRFVPMPERIVGPVLALDLSLNDIRNLADTTQTAGDLPLSVAGKFTNPSLFVSELSAAMAAQEKRASIPWASFRRWLDKIEAIDLDGATPVRSASPFEPRFD